MANAQLFAGDGGDYITAQILADILVSIYPDGCILRTGNRLKTTIVDNNTVRLADGIAATEGRAVIIDASTYDDFTIPNGTQGNKTTYYIGYHIYVDDSGAEQLETVVSLTKTETGSIRDGGSDLYIWTHSVLLNGLLLQSVTQLLPTVSIALSTLTKANTMVAGTEVEAILQSITVSYTGGSVAAGTATSKLTGITVTGTYDNESTKELTGYTLSPSSIAEGTNTITVTYEDKTATFTVTGTASGSGSGSADESTVTYKVTVNSLNIRKGAGTSYAVLTSVGKGTILTYANETSGSWIKITYNTYTGWVAAGYVSKVS